MMCDARRRASSVDPVDHRPARGEEVRKRSSCTAKEAAFRRYRLSSETADGREFGISRCDVANATPVAPRLAIYPNTVAVLVGLDVVHLLDS